MDIVSLFAGCGGMDLGFQMAGFNVVWANEFDKTIWDTYRANHPKTTLNTKSIKEVTLDEIPECEGIIGGPPCQSWSLAGSMKGINDERGQLFFEYLRILKGKQPKFFIAENVPGMRSKAHDAEFANIKLLFSQCGYTVADYMVNASDYSVPQDRKRVILVGYRTDLNKFFWLPEKHKKITLRDAIADLPPSLPSLPKDQANPPYFLAFQNQEHMTGPYSYNYMSRNRVRAWDDQSFTILASGRHAPQHPSAPFMENVQKDVCRFKPGHEDKYRRLSVRECARIQTFPDSYRFLYTKVANGYKMVGNAVPVMLAKHLADQIKDDLNG